MSDDLAADAATWVPPWQRPAAGSPASAPAGTADGSVDAASGDADSEDAVSGDAVSGDASDADGSVDAVSGDAVSGDASDADGSVDAASGDASDVDGSADAADTAEPEVEAVAEAEAETVEVAAADVEVPAIEAEVEVPAELDVPAEVEAPVGTGEGLPQQWAGLADAKWQDAPAPTPTPAPAPKQGKRKAKAQSAPTASDVDGAGELFGVPGQRTAGESDVDEAEELPRVVMDERELMPALEAILMVVDEPVTEITLAGVLNIPAEQVANALIDLSAAYTRDGRGFDLRRAAGGWRFYTRADYSSYVEKFVLDGQQMRLTQASLETLAVIAYKQPVTRSRVSAIRGVNCDGVIRTLVTRGMIEECGSDPESGAHLYRTTTLFLEKLGLDSVEQLPPLAPFLPENLDEVAAGG